MLDAQERLDRAREHLELLRSYGNDDGLRGEQARADIAAAQAEIDAAAPGPAPDPITEPDRTPKRPRGK